MMYSIPEMNMETLERKLGRIARKAAKYGCDFRFEKTGEHFETRELDELDENGKHKTEVIRYIDIDVEGEARVNGWRFAASLDYTDKGNIIEAVPGIEIPERYYSCSPWCEHCKTRRDRRNSYIVYNDETQEFKQVGKSCLRDFTGGLSAEAVAQYESWIKECEEASEFSGCGGWGIHYYDVADFMTAAAETIRVFGYVRSTDEGMSTRDLTQTLFRVEFNMPLGAFAEVMREQYYDAVDRGWSMKNADSKALAETVRGWIANNERNDNYFHNLKVACAQDYAAGNLLGLLVSAFPAYNRELEYEAERRERERREAEAQAKSSWAGEIGEKVEFKIVDFRCITSWETQWGWTGVFKLVDEAGREFTWKTSKWLDEHAVGKVCRGTIKELKEFRGVKQTELTRCRVG